MTQSPNIYVKRFPIVISTLTNNNWIKLNQPKNISMYTVSMLMTTQITDEMCIIDKRAGMGKRGIICFFKESSILSPPQSGCRPSPGQSLQFPPWIFFFLLCFPFLLRQTWNQMSCRPFLSLPPPATLSLSSKG